MMALVLSVIASSIFEGSIFNVSTSISTNLGTNPAARMELAEATKVRAGTIISSPLSAPKSYSEAQETILASMP